MASVMETNTQSNERHRSSSVDRMMQMPPKLLLRPRAHSLSRAFRPKSAPPPSPHDAALDSPEGSPFDASTSPQHSHVHWRHTSSIVGHQPPTYTDVEGYDDLLFHVGGLELDPTRSTLLQINDFLSRAATHLGYVFEAVHTTALDRSKLTSEDVACWRRLLAHTWELDHEFDTCNVDAVAVEAMDVAVAPPIASPPKSMWKRWLAHPKPPSTRLVHITVSMVQRLHRLHHVVNSCLSFGDFQFTINDLVRVAYADVS